MRLSPVPTLLLSLGLLAFLTTSSLAQQQVGEASASEITFWNSVKDSTDPEELRAYLEAFPQGAFASLARIRLNKLEQDRQKKATGPRAAGVHLDEPTIREIQERFYNLNYAITSVNGKLTPEVTNAIRTLQGKLGDPITGELTEAQLVRLRQIDPPKQWGAIAALRDARFEAVSQLPTRRDAEARVLVGCTAKGTPNCRIFSIAERQCAAAASFSERSDGDKLAVRVSISRQNGLGPAEAAALAACNKDPKSLGRCRIVSKVCADGSHGSTTNPQRDGALRQHGALPHPGL
jgi:peptidoglycan hydrolase-like protein with peptidoglycan-binding domain